MTSLQPLAAGFPAFSEDDWRAALLRRANSDGDASGLAHGAGPLAPRARTARPIASRPPGQAWRIVERIDSGTAAEAASKAAEAIAGGATGLELVLPSSLHPLARHIEADAAEIAARLAAMPKGLLVRVDIGPPSPETFDPFLELAAARMLHLAWVFDPVAAYAIHGTPATDDEAAIRAAATAFAERGLDGAAVVADGRLWHAGGATEEQELGVTLATYVHYIRLLRSPDRIGIGLATDSDQFRGIAKLRAMRLLVARILEVADLAASPLRIYAETAWRSLSERDPEMNILRATAAAFAAAVGGADSITVLPFDATEKGRSGARRLARQTQIILAEEAHVGRVADAAAGSDAIEALTAKFAEAAWERFQSIEAEGGIVAAIAEGSLLREIAEAREARLARVARGDIKLIGVNAYRGEATMATVKRAPVKRTGPLTFRRLSAPFEATS